jgi:hypothetical protein
VLLTLSLLLLTDTSSATAAAITVAANDTSTAATNTSHAAIIVTAAATAVTATTATATTLATAYTRQELWAAYNIIYPGLLEQSQAEFKKEYNGPIKAAMKDTAKPDIRAIGRHKSALLQSIIAPHFLAMTKQDVGESESQLVLCIYAIYIYMICAAYFVRHIKQYKLHVCYSCSRTAVLTAHHVVLSQ